MDNKQHLLTMLQNFISGKEEEATMDLHNYFVAKSQEVTGLGAQSDDSVEDDNQVGDKAVDEQTPNEQ